jgi:hypothetical protein
MTPKNVCGECRHSDKVAGIRAFACSKFDRYVAELVDTSDCKDFERKE